MTTSAIRLRRRLVRLIEAYPGLHLRELARQADVSEALAGYHLDHLVAEGVVEAQTEGVYRRFFPRSAPAPDEKDRELMGLLRQRVPLQIALVLLERGTATHHEITTEVDLAKSTISYHVKRLQEGGLIEHDEGGPGLRLVEPDRVGRLLLRWEPTTDLTDRFSDLWSRFYRKRKG
jgi:predicted transcriptional regulator